MTLDRVSTVAWPAMRYMGKTKPIIGYSREWRKGTQTFVEYALILVFPLCHVPAFRALVVRNIDRLQHISLTKLGDLRMLSVPFLFSSPSPPQHLYPDMPISSVSLPVLITSQNPLPETPPLKRVISIASSPQFGIERPTDRVHGHERVWGQGLVGRGRGRAGGKERLRLALCIGSEYACKTKGEERW